MLVTRDQLAAIMPRAHKAGRIETWILPLNEQMEIRRIDREQRIEMFLATVAEETGELAAREENLAYDAAGLMKHFGRLFPTREAAAALVARGPEAIANFIYADAHRPPGYKMGNTRTGDGWRYRGRGPMQITGRENYERFFASVGMPPHSDPDYLLTPDGGARSAAFFWASRGCNEIADTGDFEALTRRVNGGLINLDARVYYWHRAMAAIVGQPVGDDDPPPSRPASRVLLVGCTGPDVVALQQALNRAGAQPPLAVDGDFGPATGDAVLALQRRQGLRADAMVGPQTRSALGLA